MKLGNVSCHRDLSEDELPVVATVNRNDLPESIDQIGRGVNVTVTITNNGPSAIGHGRLTIYVPYRSPCTKKSFLLYLHSVSAGMVADTSILLIWCPTVSVYVYVCVCVTLYSVDSLAGHAVHHLTTQCTGHPTTYPCWQGCTTKYSEQQQRSTPGRYCWELFWCRQHSSHCKLHNTACVHKGQCVFLPYVLEIFLLPMKIH